MSALPANISLRRVEPEILDRLAADDPRAVRSRRDLVRINALMFQVPIMAGLLRKHVRAKPLRILEIGAGDGTFMLAVARRLAKDWPAVELTLLDRIDLVSPERRDDFRKLGWRIETVTADVFEWIERVGHKRFDAVVANLFLHHFDNAGLAHLFSGLQRLAPVLLATEPRRGRFPLAAARLLWAIGANDVTLHDAAASVRAGFAGKELSALWRRGEAVEERRGGLFSHVFAAAGQRDDL
jgi:2-polyprenyl-3-methyl-5-hydroxy-6-metoxy-1,4-benzoquinol methylase